MKPVTFVQFANSILLPVALRVFAGHVIQRLYSPRWIRETYSIYSFGQPVSLPPLTVMLASGTLSESWRQIKAVSVLVDILMLIIMVVELFRSVRDYREDIRYLEIKTVQSKWMAKYDELLDRIGKLEGIANTVAREHATETVLLDTITLERAIYTIASMHKTHSWNEIENALEMYLREQTEKMDGWEWGRSGTSREVWFNEIVARNAVSMMDVDEMKCDYPTWWSCVVDFLWLSKRPRPA